MDLKYEIDDYYIERHSRLVNAWRTLSNSSKLLQILQAGKVQNRKVYAGASQLANTQPFVIITKPLYYLKSNIDIVQLKLMKETHIFLPDKLLIVQGSKVGSIDYCDISIKVGNIPYIVEVAPKDATVIDYTWEKVNKDGSPDKRYKGNKKTHICKDGGPFVLAVKGKGKARATHALDNQPAGSSGFTNGLIVAVGDRVVYKCAKKS